MSKRETIDQWSGFYWFLQVLIVGPLYRFYFKKVEVYNIHKVPRKQPVILAPNHQNALMDALAFVSGTSFQVVFLARADIFKSKLVNKILTFLKILPVYRIRDGRSELQKNDEIFDLTQGILHNGLNPLCLYPEGNHGDKRRLRPLVKGIFRIAFKAQEDYKVNPGVKIVPVGIDYSHYQKFRHTLFMNFGDPIEVNEFWNEYTVNSSVAINLLRDRLSGEMQKVMIHIETQEYYDLYMTLRLVYRKRMSRELKLDYSKLVSGFTADKELIGRLNKCLEMEPDRIKQLDDIFKKYSYLKEKLRFRDWVPSRKKYSIVLNLLGIVGSVLVLPLVLLGILNNWPHFLIPRRFTKGISDPQFHSTAIWGAGTVMLIVYYLLIFVLVMIFLPFWWLKLLYVLTIPGSGIFALAYRKFLIKSWARIRYSFPFGKNKRQNRELKKYFDQMIEITSSVSEQYK